MATIELNEASVNGYAKALQYPAQYSIPIRPLRECFEDAEQATPKHTLFNDYKAEVGDNVPKVFFYIIMDLLYASKISTAPTGEQGYKLRYVPKQ